MFRQNRTWLQTGISTALTAADGVCEPLQEAGPNKRALAETYSRKFANGRVLMHLGDSLHCCQ